MRVIPLKQEGQRRWNALTNDTGKDKFPMFYKYNTPTNFKDITGQRFTRLTVIERAGSNVRQNALWRCRCDCGNEITVSTGQLRSGNTNSCGCYHREQTSKAVTKHGATKNRQYTSEYIAWQRMNSRCYSATGKDYPDYGGRGITVCDRWRHDFAAFLADLGPKPSPQHSIDRIDTNGHYSPDNCRWTTPVEQANNKRSNHILEWGGERLTLAEWGRKTGIPGSVIWKRLRRGWSIQRTLTEPVHVPHPPNCMPDSA